jgi:hypothetical protein
LAKSLCIFPSGKVSPHAEPLEQDLRLRASHTMMKASIKDSFRNLEFIIRKLGRNLVLI